MNYVNYTKLPSVTFDAHDKEEREYHVVVVCGTYDIRDDGVLDIADEQPPPVATDEFFGDYNQSSIRRESDLAPYKPKCDVIVNATAYAPGGRPAKAFPVSIKVSRPSGPREIPPEPYGLNPSMRPSPEQLAQWEKEVEDIRREPDQPSQVICEKTVIVCGPHFWKRSFLGGWCLSQPTPITSLPLRYEYAFGGMVTVYDPERERDRTICYPLNPVGMGYWPGWTHKEAQRRKQIPAPQIFADRDFTFGTEHRPEGFGTICRAWRPRLTLAGTYDERWQKGCWPNLPEDFDFLYWNCAHPDLAIPYLVGDEEIVLINMTHAGNLKFQLPGHIPFVLVRYCDGEIKEARAYLDTLVVEPDERKVTMVWRSTVSSNPEVRVLELRMILPAEKP